MFSDILEWVGAADDMALTTELRRLEGERRELAARESAVLAELERRRSHRADGHATMWGLLRSSVHWSDRDCRERMRLARLVDAFADIGETLFERQASVANVAEIARAHANPRVGDQIETVVGGLVRLAERREFDDMRREVRAWELRADAAQAAREAGSVDELRNAHVHLGVEGGEVAGRFGVVDAVEISEIFAMYVDAEWRTDWDVTVELHGDDASKLLMPRTDSQRRADALKRIFVDAASRPPGSRAPEPIVNVHVDHATFSDLMVEAGLFPERDVDPFDDPTPHISARLCRTDHGHTVAPHTVLQLLLEAQVRFVIRNQRGVPINWGRARRLFDGAARDAVRSLFTRCTHPGCRVPARRTDTDHAVDWAAGGRTDTDNGNPRCRRHNLLKNRGYTVHRDVRGDWHTHRPDGTEIA